MMLMMAFVLYDLILGSNSKSNSILKIICIFGKGSQRRKCYLKDSSSSEESEISSMSAIMKAPLDIFFPGLL